MCDLGIKPLMHLLEISIFSLNIVIVRLTKIMNRADKNLAHIYKTKYLKNQYFQKNVINESWTPNQIFFTEKKNWKDSTNFRC